MFRGAAGKDFLPGLAWWGWNVGAARHDGRVGDAGWWCGVSCAWAAAGRAGRGWAASGARCGAGCAPLRWAARSAGPRGRGGGRAGRGLREIAAPFVAAAPSGTRVRTRLRVSAGDVGVLAAAGRHLGSLAGRDLAARCAEGRLDARGRAASRAVRKRALTAESSSRWAGAITRASEDAWQLACPEPGRRAAVAEGAGRDDRGAPGRPRGEKEGRLAGYATAAERHAKTIRLKALQARLARVERRLEAGRCR